MYKFTFFILLSLLSLTACSDDDSIADTPAPTHWDKSSLQRQSLNGPVSSITEYKEFEGTRFILSESEYDRNGNIIRFTPVNDYENVQPPTRWVPQANNVYTYEYNQNQLVRIRVFEHNTNTVTYTLNYGDTGKYAILDLDLKPNSPLLIRNLESVESSDGRVTLSWTDDKLYLTSINDIIPNYTEYIYGESLFPLTSLSTTTDYGPEAKESISYSYHPNGAFKELRLSSGQDGINNDEITSYNVEGSVLSVVQSGDHSKQMHYKYSSRNFLTSISHLDGFQDQIGSMNAIYDLDAHKNWVRKEYIVKGFIDWDMREGTEIISREITYYQ